MSKTEARMNVDSTNVGRKVHVFQNAADRLFFEDGYIHYIHPNALKGIDKLTITGLKDAQIHMLGPLSGEQLYWTPYTDATGILNVVDCENVGFSGLDITNHQTYEPGNITLETSNALNVSRSRDIFFQNSRFVANGKTVVSIHSGSGVTMEDCEIESYYFGLNCAASTLFGERLTLRQHNKEVPDSHSAIWVASSHRHGETNKLYENTVVTMKDTKLHMLTGRSLVSGNGSYHTKSRVRFDGLEFVGYRDPTFGICTWHENFNSITVATDYPVVSDYVSTPREGFARFVNYYESPGDERRPGGPNQESPIIVNGVSSSQVTPVDG